MTRYNAFEELWLLVSIKGAKGLFCDMRIQRETIPEGYNLYELGDECSDGYPWRYANSIFVDFYGTFITKEVLPIDDSQNNAGFNTENDFVLEDNRYRDLVFYLEQENS